jgi:uncharacterized phosphosugar-binding protein
MQNIFNDGFEPTNETNELCELIQDDVGMLYETIMQKYDLNPIDIFILISDSNTLFRNMHMMRIRKDKGTPIHE